MPYYLEPRNWSLANNCQGHGQAGAVGSQDLVESDRVPDLETSEPTFGCFSSSA